MGNPYANKTFKIEIEVTVSAGDIDEHIRTNCDGSNQLELNQLQEALEKNQTAFDQLMLHAVWSKLQEYVDYAAAQDTLNGLINVAATLDPEILENLGTTTSDFAESTRPLRTSAFSVSIDGSVISEKMEKTGGGTEWQPVWKDLRKETVLGRLMEKITSPFRPTRSNSKCEDEHYLLARYLTQQKDGIHIQACCTCNAVFEEFGADESEAMGNLWKTYKEHIEKRDIINRLRKGWQDCHKWIISLD